MSGNVVWSATYTAFGEATVDSSSTITNNLRFPGQYFDEETGKHYNWNRYYDPKTGRYTQVDPIGNRLNVYKYALNNPYKYFDPYGLWPTWGRTVHQNSIDRVLSKLPKADRKILKKQQVEMDKDTSNANA